MRRNIIYTYSSDTTYLKYFSKKYLYFLRYVAITFSNYYFGIVFSCNNFLVYYFLVKAVLTAISCYYFSNLVYGTTFSCQYFPSVTDVTTFCSHNKKVVISLTYFVSFFEITLKLWSQDKYNFINILEEFWKLPNFRAKIVLQSTEHVFLFSFNVLFLSQRIQKCNKKWKVLIF